MDDNEKAKNADTLTQEAIEKLEKLLRFSIMIESDSETALTQKGRCLQQVVRRMGIGVDDIVT
jgi:hypothetical protein